MVSLSGRYSPWRVKSHQYPEFHPLSSHEEGELLFARGSCPRLRIMSHWTDLDRVSILSPHSDQMEKVLWLARSSSAPPKRITRTKGKFKENQGAVVIKGGNGNHSANLPQLLQGLAGSMFLRKCFVNSRLITTPELLPY